MVIVIMGRFPHLLLLLCVWVLSVGEAQNDYLLDLILLHHRLEQQCSPLLVVYEQTCCKISIPEAWSSNTHHDKCWVCYRKVCHT